MGSNTIVYEGLRLWQEPPSEVSDREFIPFSWVHWSCEVVYSAAYLGASEERWYVQTTAGRSPVHYWSGTQWLSVTIPCWGSCYYNSFRLNWFSSSILIKQGRYKIVKPILSHFFKIMLTFIGYIVVSNIRQKHISTREAYNIPRCWEGNAGEYYAVSRSDTEWLKSYIQRLSW